MQISAQDLANILNATLIGDPSVVVNRPGKIEEGGEGSISFLGNPKYEQYLYTTTASVVLVQNGFEPQKPVSASLIYVDNVREAFATLLSYYDSASQARPQGISSQTYIDETAVIGKNVAVGRFSTVEKNAVIGDNCVLFDQVYVGANVTLGNDVVLHPGVRILHQCKIGDRCVIFSNSVIGSDGFGYAPNEKGVFQKVPQVGNVVLENDVELGANCAIDRATIGSTILRKGVKLDNLVHIAHNVELGANSVIAGQVGIAGSTKVGAGSMMGGQVGVVGHITLAEGTKIQAQTGVGSNVDEPNTALFGTPAIKYRDYIRSYGVFKKLPEIYKELHKLRKQVNELLGGA